MSEEEKEELLRLEKWIRGMGLLKEANLIDKLQTENANYKELILNIKEKLNNIQFEVEQAWRKIEKLENNNE